MIFQLLFFDQSLLAVILLVAVFVAVYYYLPSIKRLRIFMAFKSFTEDTKEAEKQKSMECPRCGGSMERGYLVSSRPIYWRSGRLPFTPFLGGDSLAFSMRMPSFGTNSALEAHKCQKCNIIYVDDSKQGLM